MYALMVGFSNSVICSSDSDPGFEFSGRSCSRKSQLCGVQIGAHLPMLRTFSWLCIQRSLLLCSVNYIAFQG